MSKADVLLKRATFFERMAMYSDRKVFLRSLAQNNLAAGTDDNAVKAAMSALSQAIQNWINTYAEKQEDLPGGLKGLPPGVRGAVSSLTNAMKYPTLDANLLKQIYNMAAELAAVNKNLRNESDNVRGSWISNVMPAASKLMDAARAQSTALENFQRDFPPGEGGDNTGVGSGTLQVPEVQVTGRTPARGQSINPDDQKAVFQFAIEQGELVPNPEAQKPDGQLGPETRKALEGVKNYFAKKNPRNPRMTDQQAIQAAKFQGRT